MIMFVVDQIAGAEYIQPLIKRWQTEGREDWYICASPISHAYLLKQAIPAHLIRDNFEATVAEVVSRISPRLGLLSASAKSELETAARRHLRLCDIVCVQFIDTWVNYALRFWDEDDNLDLPDMLLTLDDNARLTMISEGIPAHIIQPIGQPYFEARYVAAMKQRILAPNGDRTLLVTQPISKYAGKKYGYDEMDFAEGALAAWKQAGRSWKQLDIIVHPEENPETYRILLARYSLDISIVQNDHLNMTAYLLVVGMFSSLLVQSFLCGVQTASFQPAALADMCHLSAGGQITRYTQIDELARLFDNAYADRQSSSKFFSSPLLSHLTGSCDRLERFLLSPTS